jgi:hypothetical protein
VYEEKFKKYLLNESQCQWLTSVILATQEDEIGSTVAPEQPGEGVLKTSCQPIAECHLSPKLAGRLRLGESWFQASISKRVCETSPSQ